MKRLVLISVTFALIAGGSASADSAPCSTEACKARIAVKGVTEWKSPQRMSGRLEKLTMKAGGRELSYEQAGDCVAYFYGRGVMARLSVCGRGKVPIRVRAVPMDSRRRTLELIYQVSP